MSLWAIFATGLTTGGLTCIAVQGGLLAGYLAGRRNKSEAGSSWRDALRPTVKFLLAKLIVYTLFGAILGWAGSFLQLSIPVRVTLQICVGLFMIVAALKLLHVHPLFQKLELRPPAALRRIIRRSAKSESSLTPFFLGALTILLPCGTTQAMEVLAIGSGSAAFGAAILAVFVLGTIPLFLIIGVLANSGARAFQGALARVTAILILAIGLWTINGGLALAGSPVTLQNLASALRGSSQTSGQNYTPIPRAGSQGEVQEITITVRSSGYSPQAIELKRGVPTRLRLVTNGTQGCARAFVIPSLKIERLLPETGIEVIEFTPNKNGTLPFSCTMGMYTGKFLIN